MSRFLLSLGAWQQEWESPESLWGPASLGCGTSTGPGETDSTLGGLTLSRVPQDPGEMSSHPTED